MLSRANHFFLQTCILLCALPALGVGQTDLFSTLSLNKTATSPARSVVGDFNGDGIPDIAIVDFFISGNGDVGVFLGKGDGNFQPAISFPVGADSIAIVDGDFNHDGHLDLAVVQEKTRAPSPFFTAMETGASNPVLPIPLAHFRLTQPSLTLTETAIWISQLRFLSRLGAGNGIRHHPARGVGWHFSSPTADLHDRLRPGTDRSC